MTATPLRPHTLTKSLHNIGLAGTVPLGPRVSAARFHKPLSTSEQRTLHTLHCFGQRNRRVTSVSLKVKVVIPCWSTTGAKMYHFRCSKEFGSANNGERWLDLAPIIMRRAEVALLSRPTRFKRG